MTKYLELIFNPNYASITKCHSEERSDLICVNDKEIGIGTTLQPFDVIEIGKTRLIFVPLCGERFVWK